MKRALTLLAVIAVIQASAQVTNGGFESWNTQIQFEDPQDWENGNWQDGNGLLTTTKVTTMAPSGSFAVHLETIALPDDTAFGFVLQGEFDDDPVAGIPWSTEIQTIEGYARYDVEPGDTAIMVFFGWVAGNIVGQEAITFTGSQPTWMPFSQPLTFGAITPDSILIAAASSNAINEIGITPGSWLELDAIELVSPNEPNPDMIPNYDFENWMDVSVEDPNDWSTYNSWVVNLGITSVSKSTDANSGSFSARLETITYEWDTLESIMTNGEIDEDGPFGGVPYVAEPTTFSGAYKFMPSGQDTARIGAIFYNGGNPVGVSFINIGQNTPMWTTFSENLFLIGQPDTMSIIVFSGENAGSVLHVDDLDLSGGTVGVEELSKTDLKVFPNPVNDQLTLLSPSDLGLSELSIIDLSGRTVLMQTAVLNTRSGHVIDLNDLPSGTYILEITKSDQVLRKHVIKE